MGDRQIEEQTGSLGSLLKRQMRRAALDLPFAAAITHDNWREAAKLETGFDPTMFDTQSIHVAAYQHILNDVLARSADPSFDFVYAHLPVPHWPVVFDRRTGTWTTQPSADYFSSLALADRTLGEIHAALDRPGLWDDANVIVLGDHGLIERPASQAEVERRRVPFLVKLAGQRERVDLDVEFDTTIVHDLVLELLREPALSPVLARDWLFARRVAPSPPPKG
jgi:arylsulfatase A-like enzyme